MRCKSATPKRAWPRSASAAAWAWPCASSADYSDSKKIDREVLMARVAVVTGGTRGIGEAISIMLDKAGYKVAATYHGNDARAQEFSKRTGIKTFKFDVGDFQAVQAGIKESEGALGPIDVVVNNAGITRDGTLQRMSWENWNEVVNTNLGS